MGITMALVAHSAQVQLDDSVSLIWTTRRRSCPRLTEVTGHPAGGEPFNGHIKTAERRPLYSNTVIGTQAVDGWAVTLVQRGGACAGCGRAQSPPRCTKCKSPLINGQCIPTSYYSVTYKPVKFTGKKVTDIKAKVQPAPRRLTAFVGRLHIDTSEEDLHEYLSAVGIEDVKCKKLAAKDGKVFKTAAFMVSCNAKSRDVFYDESVWPSGCELRDWVFYEKKTHGDQ